MADWYVKSGGAEHGPISSTDLVRLARASKIGPDTLVRKGTDGTWSAARMVTGLFDEPRESIATAKPIAEPFESAFAEIGPPLGAEPASTAKPVSTPNMPIPPSARSGPGSLEVGASVIGRIIRVCGWSIVGFVVFDYYLSFDQLVGRQETIMQQIGVTVVFATRLIAAYVLARMLEGMCKVFARFT